MSKLTEFEFADGSIKRVTPLGIVKHVCAKMSEQNIPITFHEFVGGHNYVCFRVTLFDRIRELFQQPINGLEEDTSVSPGV